MKNDNSLTVKSLTVLIIITFFATLTVHTQTPAQLAAVQRINTAIDNGIFVDTVKVYDDNALQLMLNAARARLATLQTFDQTGLLSRIGAVTGASLQQQAISAQVGGPPIPGMTTANLGGTGSTQTMVGPSGTTTTTAAGQPVQNVTATTAQQNAPLPTLPSTSVGLPSTGFNVSSLDALNEMMQLTYEIANLQMLLEGSLTDRYVRGQRVIKPRTTLGFPITITSQPPYKDAVAVVEIESIAPLTGTFSTEPPTVTALLPREKTYNVASLTDKMTSVGGGVVTQVLSGGFSFLRGRKSYYLVQDQDTVAMMQTGPNPQTTSFSWQFRPVLGQRFVRSGLKQTFVQLAVPVLANYGCYGGIKVRTYWRRYDGKNGVLKDIIAESIREETLFKPIPVYDQRPTIEGVDYEDLGLGQLLMTVKGRFLSGTYIRVGPTLYREGTPGFTSELSQLRFVTSGSDLAKFRGKLVSRDGTEIDIASPQVPLPALSTQCDLPPAAAVVAPAVGAAAPVAPAAAPAAPGANVVISAFDNSNSVVTVTFTAAPAGRLEDYVMLIGGKVYGFSDAPIERDPTGSGVLRVVVPNALLRNAASVEVRSILAPSAPKLTLSYKAEGSTEKIVALGKIVAGNTRFLLYGTRLANASILLPTGINLASFDGNANTNQTLRIFDVPDAQVKDIKQIVLQKVAGERPVFVAMPAVEADKKPTVTFKGRVTVGTNDLPIQGDSWEKLLKVTYNGVEIPKRISADKKTLTLLDLTRLGVTSTAKEIEIEFEFAEGVKSTLKIEIISGRIEVIRRDP